MMKHRTADETPASIAQRYASRAMRVDGRDAYSPTVLRALIATATTGRVVVARLIPIGGGKAIDAPVMDRPGPWPEVVFHHNGSILAALERRRSDATLYRLELVSREAYFTGRAHLPLNARHQDELIWELATLDASLSASVVATGEPAPAADLERIDVLRRALAPTKPATQV